MNNDIEIEETREIKTITIYKEDGGIYKTQNVYSFKYFPMTIHGMCVECKERPFICDGIFLMNETVGISPPLCDKCINDENADLTLDLENNDFSFTLTVNNTTDK